MVHQEGRNLEQPGQVIWNRRYQYALDSNRLLATSLPGDPANLSDYVATPGYSAKYNYDPHGNITAMPHLPQMRWDFKDQLSATTGMVNDDKPPPAKVPETTYYIYDAAGQRVRKVTETQTGALGKQHIYLGVFEVYHEYSSGAVTLERESLHVMDDKQRAALIEMQTIKDQSPIARLQPLVRYQLDNHLGSVSLELDERAAVITYEEYTPYGSTAYCGGRSAAEVSLKRYRYTGKERDKESGLYYHGARYYALWLGRWTSCDPTGIHADLNLYTYTLNNPVVLIDPNGREPSWWEKAISFVPDTLAWAMGESAANAPERADTPTESRVEFGEFLGRVALIAGSAALGGVVGRRVLAATGSKILAGAAGEMTGGAVSGVGAVSEQDIVRREVSSQGTYAKAAGIGALLGLAVGAVGGTFSRVFKGPISESGAGKQNLGGSNPEGTAASKSAAPKGEAPHVGNSPDVPKQKVNMSVADAGYNKCVGNVCAIMKNQELNAGPESGYTTKELEKELGIDFGRTKSGKSNPAVATPDKAALTIEKVTGLKVTNLANPVNFAEAKAEGQYAIFLKDSHVVYARISPGGKVSVLDANVGRGWGSWDDFLKYAEKNPTLYGANPAKSNKAFHFVK